MKTPSHSSQTAGEAENCVKASTECLALPQQLARQIASETGVKIAGKLYADVLGDNVRSYAEMMRHNYKAILAAQK